tara:strand:+ start:36 stop:794 length:759 start_codon:yes stop_codon:yes gene_type:complete
MSNKYVGAAKFGYQKVVKPAVTAIKKTFSKKSPTITSIRPGTDLTTKRAIQDKVVKAVDEGTKKGLGGAKASDRLKQSASKIKRDKSKKIKGMSYEYDRLTKKFAKTKANIEKKKIVAGATAVGSGTAAAGLIGKKIKDKRDKKMGGGMMGRRMGYSEGSNGKKFGAGDGVITPYEKRRGQAIKAAIKARKGKRMQAANGTDLSPSFEAIKKFMKTQRTRGNTQPPKEPMRDRMRDKMKQPLKKQPLKRKKP